MTSESGSPEERRWLLQPPAPGQINVSIEAAEGAALTPAAREAINTLMHELIRGDVQGFAATATCSDLCPGDASCQSLLIDCSPEGRCRVLHQAPCVANISCRVGP